MKTQIDHLVVGALSLEQGVEYIRESLGVDMPYGGIHMEMGTHNHLMQIGKNMFLEIIAINNEINRPKSPRWYGLDDPFIRKQIEIQPTLLTWVVNTSNIHELMQQATFSPGKAEVIRRGDLSWYFGLPSDGRLLAGGMLPYVIEWLTDKHPSENMVNLGCNLQGLEIHHPYSLWLQSALQSIDAANLVKINSLPENDLPYLKAQIKTPTGIKELLSYASFSKRS